MLSIETRTGSVPGRIWLECTRLLNIVWAALINIWRHPRAVSVENGAHRTACMIGVMLQCESCLSRRCIGNFGMPRQHSSIYTTSHHMAASQPYCRTSPHVLASSNQNQNSRQSASRCNAKTRTATATPPFVADPDDLAAEHEVIVWKVLSGVYASGCARMPSCLYQNEPVIVKGLFIAKGEEHWEGVEVCEAESDVDNTSISQDQEQHGHISLDPSTQSGNDSGERQQIITTAVLGIVAMAALGLAIMGVKKLMSVQMPKIQKVRYNNAAYNLPGSCFYCIAIKQSTASCKHYSWPQCLLSTHCICQAAELACSFPKSRNSNVMLASVGTRGEATAQGVSPAAAGFHG